MKATVWTSWNPMAQSTDEGKPRCIFNGDIAFPPKVDEYIVVRDGFCAEKVRLVTHNFVTGEVEISIYGTDADNEYEIIPYT